MTQSSCPICRAPNQAKFRPFCSKACSDRDLLNWLKGSYLIAGGNDDAKQPEADNQTDADDFPAIRRNANGFEV
jgi:endogenous inhibitor of DNA gyrase (YacG/DUF329 family)